MEFSSRASECGSKVGRSRSLYFLTWRVWCDRQVQRRYASHDSRSTAWRSSYRTRTGILRQSITSVRTTICRESRSRCSKSRACRVGRRPTSWARSCTWIGKWWFLLRLFQRHRHPVVVPMEHCFQGRVAEAPPTHTACRWEPSTMWPPLQWSLICE